MDRQRRKFLQQASVLSAGAGFLPFLPESTSAVFQELSKAASTIPANKLALDEGFWYQVRQQYQVSPQYINLENGYYSLLSNEVLQAQYDNLRLVNQQASYYFRKKMYADRAQVKKMLCAYAGVASEELALVRNTTEAMNILIMGLPMQAGDEFLYTNQDYFSMKEAIEYRAKRFGIVAKKMDWPLHTMSDNEIIAAYEKAITPKTKVLLLTHLINVTGQILPVREIANRARAKGVEVICDVAQSFAQVLYTLPDLGCAYIGASLHKWLGAPLGTGFLYVQKDKIAQVQPLIGVNSYKAEDIRKFEYWGTHPAHSDLSIAAAIRFQQSIGRDKIEARLRYLRNYWRSKVEKMPKVNVLTPLEEQRSAAITTISVPNIPAPELEKKLFEDYRIYISSIDYQGIKGNRVTPHIYTNLPELDAFVDALRALSA